MVKYASRELVARALDAQASAYEYDAIDRALEFGSRTIEGPAVCNRIFYPETGTWYFDWPPTDRPTDGFTLWLDEIELISIATLTNGNGDAIPSTDYHLEPRNDGPPFDSIEIDMGSGANWDSADGTWQRSIGVAGVRGYNLTQRPAGALAVALASPATTTVTITDGHAIGVWDLLTVGTERMEVTGRSLVDTTVNLTAGIDGEVRTVTVPVGDGTAFTAGEEITIDAETMLIRSIAGNNLLVKRQVAGSQLAAHLSGADVYAARALTVTRGALGTTAATHLISAPITAQVYPQPVVTGTVALAMAQLLQEQAGYSRTVGSGEGRRQAAGAAEEVAAARASYGRKGRNF